jgi:hypothetical protein
VNASGELFREGSTKAAVFASIKDGKKHSKEDVFKICDAADKSRQLVMWVLKKLRDSGEYNVISDRESIQIVKTGKGASAPAKKAAPAKGVKPAPKKVKKTVPVPDPDDEE